MKVDDIHAAIAAAEVRGEQRRDWIARMAVEIDTLVEGESGRRLDERERVIMWATLTVLARQEAI